MFKDKNIAFFCAAIFALHPVQTEAIMVISFIEGPKRPDTNFAHFGFQLPSSETVLEKLEYVKTQGIRTLVEEKVKCCYALQDKFWVSDPDGYRWEYYFFEADVDENDTSTSECCTENATEGESCCTNEQRAEAAECC